MPVAYPIQSGFVVIAPYEEITVGSWVGAGYFILDPGTGNGAYRISGGTNGADTTDPAFQQTQNALTVWAPLDDFLEVLAAEVKIRPPFGAVATIMGGVMIAVAAAVDGYQTYQATGSAGLGLINGVGTLAIGYLADLLMLKIIAATMPFLLNPATGAFAAFGGIVLVTAVILALSIAV